MIRQVLIDLSGTLFVDDKAIPGAVAAFKRLIQQDLKVKLLTNTTQESQKLLHNRLLNLGYEVNKEDIITSISACRDLIEKNKLLPLLLVSEEAMEDFEGVQLPSNKDPDTVVVGLAPNKLNYNALNEAFVWLQQGAQLIAIHEGKYFKTNKDLSLGPGGFVKCLEFAADCKATVIGKPNKSFFLSALDENVAPSKAVMIGDDVLNDVKGAMEAGIKGYLVQTGKYRKGDETKIDPAPNGVFPSFVEAVDNILEQLNQ